MNQERIGKFIAECRKKQKLTQQELAEKLGVTDRSISNWENGKNMPDLSLFKPLCELLDITINDLMSGEKIDEHNYQKKFEENIVNTIDYTNKKITSSNNIFGITLLVVGFLIILSAISIFPSESSWSSIYSLVGVIVSLIGFTRLTRRFIHYKKLLLNVSYLILIIFILFILDYANVKLNHQAPRFSIIKYTSVDSVIYDTPFYDVYRCHFDTKDEYWLIKENHKYNNDTISKYCK